METTFKYNMMQEMNGVIPKKQKNVSFKRLKELYINHAKTNHKKYKNQRYYINILESYFGNGKPVNEIKPEDVNKFIEYLRKSGKHGQRKNSSINRFLEILSKMFNLAIDNGELTENPLRKVPKLHEDNHKIRYLTTDEESRLFANIDSKTPYLRPIVTTALQTGMRRGEIFGMKWENVDFISRNIHILDSKSGKSREVPINDKLYEVLQSLPKTSDYVFTNPKTNQPYVDIKKSFNLVIKQAHIENFCFHDLRHTFATRMVMADVDLFTLMEILGHNNVQTTMRYAHVIPGRKMEAINRLARYES